MTQLQQYAMSYSRSYYYIKIQWYFQIIDIDTEIAMKSESQNGPRFKLRMWNIIIQSTTSLSQH